MELEQESDTIARIAKLLGAVFLGAAVFVLTVLLVSFYQFMSEPNSVFSVAMFAEFLQADSPAITVTVDGRDAFVNLDRALRYILVVFVGAMSILALGSILHACVGGGLALLKFAKNRTDTNDN